MTSIISALFFRTVRNVARAEIDGKNTEKVFFNYERMYVTNLYFGHWFLSMDLTVKKWCCNLDALYVCLGPKWPEIGGNSQKCPNLGNFEDTLHA